MAFQIKDFASISASMVNWMKAATKKVTDFNIGSVVRTLVEAVATEIDELYQQMWIGLREAIPVSVFNSFQFARIEAVPAGGLVRVTVTSSAAAVTVAAGTVFTTPGTQVAYTSTEEKSIAAGNTFVDVPVVAGTAGIVGNMAANQAFTLNPAPTNYVSSINQTAFINGVNEESDDARLLRFQAYIASLNRGTVAAVEYGLKTTVLTDTAGNVTERVVSAKVIEPWIADNTQPVSLVNCYVHNGSGGTSAGLVAKARSVVYGYTETNGVKIPGWKAAGVQVEVFAATEQTLAVAAVLTAAAGYVKATLVTAANTAIAEYIRSLPIGDTAVRSEIVAIAMNIDGVYNFVTSAPAGDTAVAASIKLMPGVITIT